MSGVDLSSFESFMDSMKTIPQDQLTKLNDLLVQMREEEEKSLSQLTKLYHGTAQELAKIIKQDGFRITDGRRGGAFGSAQRVQNHGIFLTDCPNLANYFGANRADYWHDVLPVFVDVSHVLDYAKAPLSVRKIGIQLLNDYNGTSTNPTPHRTINQSDWWWLLDQAPFVSEIKNGGYSGVMFKETIDVRRQANALNAATYIIFDPTTIHQKKGVSLGEFYERLLG